jgi:hypothetical protein
LKIKGYIQGDKTSYRVNVFDFIGFFLTAKTLPIFIIIPVPGISGKNNIKYFDFGQFSTHL